MVRFGGIFIIDNLGLARVIKFTFDTCKLMDAVHFSYIQSTVSERVYHFVDAEELLSFLITAPSSDNATDDECR